MRSKFLRSPTSPMTAVDLTINNSVHFNTGLPPLRPSMSSASVSVDSSIDQTGYWTSFVPETQNCNWGSQNKTYRCPDCGKGLSHRYTLDRHRKTVCGKIRNITGKYKCNFCNKRYKSLGSLSRHHKFECRVDPQFSCIFCNSKFTQQCSLSRHLKKKHPEEVANDTVDEFVKVVPQQSYIKSNNLYKRDRRRQ
ncbi:PREDICTED: putative transcription factor Ovo-like 1 [Trachymyrmex cornetzi]|uniref:putative transcription factor Ovo-like 1 n=1 Tax=Trachymyrmex cornetzi TaxID=471704 RepID=UPI00084F1221|nr:PREDICTED: putative transcription factor Ovo-like 1 [Trachymyrmex cornetzi]